MRYKTTILKQNREDYNTSKSILSLFTSWQ